MGLDGNVLVKRHDRQHGIDEALHLPLADIVAL